MTTPKAEGEVVEETQAAVVEAPKETPEAQPKGPTPEDFNRLRATEQRKAAEATKRAEAAERRASESEDKLTSLEAQIRLLKASGDPNDELGERIERLATEEARIKREQAKVSEEREIVARFHLIDELSAQYGIPASELEGYNDPVEMQKAAQAYEVERLRQEVEDLKANGPKPAATEPEPAEKPSGFDTGVGSYNPPNLNDMTREERLKLYDKQDREARQRSMRRN